jgi:hypothetical protein
MCSSCFYCTLRNPLPAEEELETQKATFKGFSFAKRQATMLKNAFFHRSLPLARYWHTAIVSRIIKDAGGNSRLRRLDKV